MAKTLERFNLEYNPFQPSAAGPPVKGPASIPEVSTERLTRTIDVLESGGQAKVIVVTGDYGSGKTCLLDWLKSSVFPDRRIMPFYFDNPGVQFYDLANALLRTVGP